MVLRDASGLVADSLNYGGLVDPWAAEGDQAASGARLSGCYVPAPGSVFDPWSTVVTPVATNTSAGRYPDGADNDSNCTDFLTQTVATLSASSPVGASNLKVTSTEGFRPGQAIHIDSGANHETAVISTVGTAGASTLSASTAEGATILATASVAGFAKGQSISIDDGANSEMAVVASVRSRGANTITLAAPLARPHASGASVTGSGLGLATPLTRAHASGTQVSDNLPTPGAPNQYHSKNP